MLATKAARMVYDEAGRPQGTVRMDESEEGSPAEPQPPTEHMAKVCPQPKSIGVAEAAGSDCAEASVSDMSTTEIRRLTKGTAVKMLRRHAGLEHDVRGNGTCWLYAAMAAMGICEHAFTSGTGGVVTPLDIRLSASLLNAMRMHFLTLTEPTKPGRYQRDASKVQDYKKIEEQLEKINVWVPSMGTDMAVWGTESLLSLLARTLERSIIVLDGETLAGLRDSFHGREAGLQREEKYHHVHDPARKHLYR